MIFSSGTFDIVEPARPGEMGPGALRLGEPGLGQLKPGRSEVGNPPLRLVNRPDGARTLARLLLFVPGLCALLAPAGVAAYLACASTGATVLADTSYAALVALPLVWAALAIAAALSILPRIGRSRVVTITRDQVSALETGLTGERSWTQPLRAYKGIAHHVRASAGIVSHEIILVHEDPARSVLLMTAPIVHQSSIDRLAAALHLPVIASREVYRTRFSGLRRLLWARVVARPGELALEAHA